MTVKVVGASQYADGCSGGGGPGLELNDQVFSVIASWFVRTRGGPRSPILVLANRDKVDLEAGEGSIIGCQPLCFGRKAVASRAMPSPTMSAFLVLTDGPHIRRVCRGGGQSSNPPYETFRFAFEILYHEQAHVNTERFVSWYGWRVAKTPNPNRRSERSRTDTLAAALELCTELGYGKVTVEAIAARAGVSKATVYRWWPSKGAIVLEAIDDVAITAAGFPDTGDIGADLRKQIASIQTLLTGPNLGPAVVGVIAEAQHDPDLGRQMGERLFQPRIEQASQRLRKAQTDGQIAADADLSMLIDHLYAPLYYRLLLHLGIYPPRRLAAHIDHILRASAPGSASSPS